jgi:hypothetical protein
LLQFGWFSLCKIPFDFGRSGEWGDHVTLQAAADFVRITFIQIVMLDITEISFEFPCGSVWGQGVPFDIIQGYMLH